MRLIDADELIEQMEADGEHIEDAICKLMHYAFIRDIKSQPTIDPVKHGRWIREWDMRGNISDVVYSCSVCEAMQQLHKTNYCPNCGALMDGEADHDDHL